jgi:hypothetical protein
MTWAMWTPTLDGPACRSSAITSTRLSPSCAFLPFPFPVVLLPRLADPIHVRLDSNKTLTLDLVNTYGRLYTWKGKDTSLKPIVLMVRLELSCSE